MAGRDVGQHGGQRRRAEQPDRDTADPSLAEDRDQQRDSCDQHRSGTDFEAVAERTGKQVAKRHVRGVPLGLRKAGRPGRS